MDKLIVLLLFLFTVTASEEIVDLYELIHERISLTDSHSDRIPDTDTSENSEDDTEAEPNYTVTNLLVDKQQYKLDDYKSSFFELFLETPNPPPKES